MMNLFVPWKWRYPKKKEVSFEYEGRQLKINQE
jgi:hypothetical protein